VKAAQWPTAVSNFWDSEGTLLVEFVERGVSITPEQYVQTLKKSK
jgi:hypothetical protein